VIREPQKPLMQPYLKSVDLYYLHHFWSDSKKIKALESFMNRKPICWNCNGSAKVKDTRQRCPVEGLKDADLVPCPSCVKGVMLVQDILDAYKDSLSEYKKEVLRYKKDLSIYNSIKSKLTQEEWEWI